MTQATRNFIKRYVSKSGKIVEEEITTTAADRNQRTNLWRGKSVDEQAREFINNPKNAPRFLEKFRKELEEKNATVRKHNKPTDAYIRRMGTTLLKALRQNTGEDWWNVKGWEDRDVRNKGEAKERNRDKELEKKFINHEKNMLQKKQWPLLDIKKEYQQRKDAIEYAMSKIFMEKKDIQSPVIAREEAAKIWKEENFGGGGGDWNEALLEKKARTLLERSRRGEAAYKALKSEFLELFILTIPMHLKDKLNSL